MRGVQALYLVTGPPPSVEAPAAGCHAGTYTYSQKSSRYTLYKMNTLTFQDSQKSST